MRNFYIFNIVRSFYKYKCLWSVRVKDQGSSLHKKVLHTYTLKID